MNISANYCKPIFIAILVALIAIALFYLCKKPATKVTANSGRWPIGINELLNSIQSESGCNVDFKEEFKSSSNPPILIGCSLFVHCRQASYEKVSSAVYNTIMNDLKSNGFKVRSTDSSSCKADFYFVYNGASKHGAITMKALRWPDGMEITLFLNEDSPNDFGLESE